jgi:hypothetical protein
MTHLILSKEYPSTYIKNGLLIRCYITVCSTLTAEIIYAQSRIKTTIPTKEATNTKINSLISKAAINRT